MAVNSRTVDLSYIVTLSSKYVVTSFCGITTSPLLVILLILSHKLVAYYSESLSIYSLVIFITKGVEILFCTIDYHLLLCKIVPPYGGVD